MQPLDGIRILDLSRLLPGPMATLHLANLGATVIRIEAPEPDRGLATLLEPVLGCNKRSITLDLRQPPGRDAFLELAKDADVVVESFRPGVVDRMGISYEAVRGRNPRVVYCSITGYGQTGPDCLHAGHDINYLAASGVGDQIGNETSGPAIPNLQIGDLLGGTMTAVMGILAALVSVQIQGVGCYIDVSMTDSLMAHSVVASATRGLFPQPPSRGQDALSGGLACYNYYRTADGRYLAVGALERKFWERLCDALGRADLKPKHIVFGPEAQAAIDELQRIFAEYPAAHWLDKFRNVDCCVNLVLTFEEAMASGRPGAKGVAVEIR